MESAASSPGGPGRQRVTAKEVADAAQVSTSVVSLVLNGKHTGRVGAATREKVLAAADELGYRIDGRGRSLATGRTGIIGYAAPDVNPFFAVVQTGLLRELNPDYQVITVATDLQSSAARANLSQMLALGPDALVVSTVEPERIRELRPRCPVLILDAPEVESDYPRINVDVDRSAAELARYLTDLGHRRFAYLDLQGGSRTIHVRRNAFVETVRASSPECEVVHAESPVDAEAARALVRDRWLAWSRMGITAVACGSDPQAFGTIAALHDLGVDVPAEVSVVGADDQSFSTIVQPALTTVRIPALEMGRRAGSVVRRMLTEDVPAKVEILETELVVRDSAGPPPGAPR